ncbi:MAG: peptidase U35 [Rhodobacteraceae bacterium]|nr:MAG: peptidase U35 [Paracoccaceae bacterium]
MPPDLITRDLDVRPTTLNRAERTVEAIISTGAPVARFDMDGPYEERLEISSAAVDLSRASGAPVLDSHRQDGINSILGRVISVRIEGDQLVATLKISTRHEAILDDIEDGTLRGVSIGYSIQQHRDDTDRATGRRVRIATRWTLAEVSIVAVPADAASKIRSIEMPPDDQTTTTTTTAVAQPQPVTQTRAQVNVEIRSLAQVHDLPAAWSDDLIDREVTVEDARAAALTAIETRQITAPITPQRVTNVRDLSDPATLVTRMGEAMYARTNPSHQLSEEARPYYGMATPDIARDCLNRSGGPVTGKSGPELITRALQSTSDFPAIFADSANRTLQAEYQAAPATLKAAARKSTAKDFRKKTKIQLGEAPTLEKVNEAGEFKRGALAEAKEYIQLDSFGMTSGLTRKAMINDDTGAFADLIGKHGRAAAETEAQFLVDLLETGSGAGPVMDDGSALFHANHGNLAASGGALSETTLSAARLAMRKQKGLAKRPINVAPKFLIVPPELETTAEKLLASIQPTTSGDVNPFAGKLELLVEARLTSTTRWYVTADPAMIEGLEYAYLQGEEGPQVETRAGFEVDGIEFKVRLDFGAAFLDWRSWQMNPGA